jgi:L-2-hydroxyglutarate oxidase
MDTERVAVVGGGILGITVAHRLASAGLAQVTVFEKEAELAAHQSGRNSNVVHAGLYYAPGSEKAILCRRGRVLLEEFCRRRALPYVTCGKVVVALDERESAALGGILERAHANGVSDARLVDRRELSALEPHVRGVRALHSPSTAITDYAAVTRALAAEAVEHGAEVRTSTPVTAVSYAAGRATLRTPARHEEFDRIVLCAGLQSDRIARQAGLPAEPRIVPFRGEYWAVRESARDLVQRLVYPVPDPRYPFLGVHLTPQVDGSVLVGPNAVLALAREGYRWHDVHPGELAQTLGWPGFARFARVHWRTGAAELYRSASKSAFTNAARRYVPELRRRDLVRARSGVRAQSMNRDGSLVDDFVIQRTGRVVAVRNAPSPAATSAFAIAERIADALDRPA